MSSQFEAGDPHAYTVVIPTLVDEPYLTESIDSILQQSLPPTRILVVVNGDSNRLPEFRESLQGYSSHIQILTSADKGMAPALKVGIGEVSTPYICFLDADDVWLPDKQSSQIDHLARHPEVHAVSGMATNFRITETGVRETGKTVPAAMFTATTFRTSCFLQFGPPDSTASHHTWLYRWWNHARNLGIRTDGLPQEVLMRRIHENNSWVTASAQGHAELLSELREHVRARRESAS